LAAIILTPTYTKRYSKAENRLTINSRFAVMVLRTNILMHSVTGKYNFGKKYFKSLYLYAGGKNVFQINNDATL
jgi:hypothetical protein